MNPGCSGTTNTLDQIRRDRGGNTCRALFRKMSRECRQQAIELINDSRLSFTSLFILQRDINVLDLRKELNERNRIALTLCEKISDTDNSRGTSNDSVSMDSEEVHGVLLWIFHTGAPDDGLSEDFDQILDVTAAVLTKTHHEKQVLPQMIDQIFQRNRKGRYLHDLVWACFQTRDKEALRLISGHLCSPNAKDTELARTLLHLPEEEVPLRTCRGRQKEYAAYQLWLRDNDPYIQVNAESFQYTSSPVPCFVDWSAKYLCGDGSVSAFEPLTQPSVPEQNRVTNFQALTEGEKEALAGYSQKLHRENLQNWKQWMQYPIEKQLQLAQYGGGDSNDLHRR